MFPRAHSSFDYGVIWKILVKYRLHTLDNLTRKKINKIIIIIKLRMLNLEKSK